MIPILSSQGTGLEVILGGVLGLAVAVGVGLAIFVAGVRVNLRRFFTVTGVVLIFVSAGLVVYALAEFTEAGLIPNTGIAFNLQPILPDNGPLGSVLAGLFGYRAAPTILEVIAYFAYLVPVLFLFITDRPLIRRTAVAA